MPTLSYSTHRMILRWMRGIPTTPPSALFLGALTKAPNSDGSGVEEPSSSGYARQSITLTDEIQANGASSCANASPIVFSTATQNWPSVTHLGIFDQAGNLLIFGPMAAARAVSQGDTLAFGLGTIQVRLK